MAPFDRISTGKPRIRHVQLLPIKVHLRPTRAEALMYIEQRTGVCHIGSMLVLAVDPNRAKTKSLMIQSAMARTRAAVYSKIVYLAVSLFIGY